MSEQLDLPLAPIHRIVKAAVPAGAGVSKDVKQALGKAASLFILYLTSTSVSCSSTLEGRIARGYPQCQFAADSFVACCCLLSARVSSCAVRPMCASLIIV
jgi:hypothetical protein